MHRCWQFVPRRVSALKRILHEASFVFTSTLRALSLPCGHVYVIVSPPLLLGVAGWLVGTIRKCAFCFSCSGHASGRRCRARNAEVELVYAGVVCARIVRLPAREPAFRVSLKECSRVFGLRGCPTRSLSIFRTQLIWKTRDHLANGVNFAAGMALHLEEDSSRSTLGILA